MPNVDKLIEKMQNQPTGIRPEEAEKVLCAHGYRFGRQRGSHRQYINGTGDVLTIPNHNPLKKVYIDIILQRIGKK
jgi:predicted RNA binding protein YcfA (HicA-like mRNA interferase family)